MYKKFILIIIVSFALGVFFGPKLWILFLSSILDWSPNIELKYVASSVLTESNMGKGVLVDRLRKSDGDIREIALWGLLNDIFPDKSYDLWTNIPNKTMEEKRSLLEHIRMDFSGYDTNVKLLLYERSFKENEPFYKLMDEILHTMDKTRNYKRPKLRIKIDEY